MHRAVISAFFVLAASLLTNLASAQSFGALARVLPEETALIPDERELALRLGLSQPVPFRVFSLADPWRVVLDFREVAWEALPDGLDADARIVSMAAGRAPDPGWSRLVLTLDRPMAPRIAAMETDAVHGTAAVSLTLEPVPEGVFRAGAGLPETLASGIAPRHAPPPARADGRLVVVLDPGHGGVDPGAVRGEHTEAALVLGFARELADALRRTGRAEVILTRQGDVFVPLPTRVSIARGAGADLFVSIHADAVAEGRARGATVYTLAEEASDAASAALAEQHDRADLLQGIDLGRSDDEIAGVLMDLARVETAPRAEAFAVSLVDRLREAEVRLHRRPRGEAGFTVLRAADIPSVLLEIGFMSEAGDLDNILNPDWRARMQGAIVEAILDWAEADAVRSALLRQ